MSINTHIVEPQEGHQHTHTVIFLHGKGSDCEEFADEFFESEASEPAGCPRTLPDLFPTIRWVFPPAPLSESTRFQCVESQWFDMWSVEHPNVKPELQTDGLKQSIQLVLDVVEQVEALVPSKNIFLGGISQGFATVYSAYTSSNKTYAGLIGLCSWAPTAALDIIKGSQDETSNSTEDKKRLTNVFLRHSRDDDIIPVQEGRILRDTLRDRADTAVEFHEYGDGGHWVNEPEGVDDIAAFLHRIMDECR
ncbi:phospholipase/carboxylesterase [Hypoxylon rubiginosum]|uniref:Phospholipase/carboxylesterase n=1 Tax=Hypoxylon rubiginosum TaxID=110542 RepID=A0ACB9YT31_9PEZI|nr:phospholipase/carboxylesterase [Hypoxylon rubiginosum]